MNYEEFNRLMFHIAHSWTVNVDLFEYVGMLNNIYERITIDVQTSLSKILIFDLSLINCRWGKEANHAKINSATVGGGQNSEYAFKKECWRR